MALRIATFNVQLFTDTQEKAAAGDLIGAAAAFASFERAVGSGDLSNVDTAQQARALRFAERILDAPYDVVCLQEMWSLPAWWAMRTVLEPGGYVFALGGLELRHDLPTPPPETKWTDRDVIDAILEMVAGWQGPVGSGLAVVSRLPPIPFTLPGDAGAQELFLPCNPY